MKRISLIIGAPAVLGVLAGCGAADDFNPDVVAQAADKTAAAGGARLSFTESVKGQTLHGDGFIDSKGRKARVTVRLPQGQGEIESVFLARTIYLRLPSQAQKKVGKPWVKIDLDRFGQQSGIDFGALQSTSSNDPSAQLDQLRGAGNVKRVGDETVRGTSTTHYKATVDLRKAADRAPAAQREAARRSIEKIIKLSGQGSVPMEVWIDKAGRARRFRATQAVQGQSFTYTMDLYDFGTREALKAPPASETKDLTDLAAKQAGG
jgi:hypothetical protein